MKRLIYITISVLMWLPVRGQNFPACDSLVINCCVPDVVPSTTTLTLTASNSSSVLFDYPGFVLLDANLDTIAVEQTTYFGIGTFPQVHIMNVVAPLTLPFTGMLHLDIWFNDTLACSFPVTIPDIAIGITLTPPEKVISIFPNPVSSSDKLTVSLPIPNSNVKLSIYNTIGALLLEEKVVVNTGFVDIDISDLREGVYILKAQSDFGNFCGKIIKQHSINH